MVIRIAGEGANPECPLCKKAFEKVPYRGVWFYMCKFCEIFINVDDPCRHAWASYKPEEDKDIICPAKKCNAEMRFFFRSDGFMKAYCPVCHTSVSLSEDLPLPQEMIRKREEGGE